MSELIELGKFVVIVWAAVAVLGFCAVFYLQKKIFEKIDKHL